MTHKAGHLISEVKAHIRGDLVVSASARVNFPHSFDAETLDELGFYVRVDVFSGGIQLEISPIVQDLQFFQPSQDFPAVAFRDDPLFPEHNAMSPAPPDIVGNEHLITWGQTSHVSTR